MKERASWQRRPFVERRGHELPALRQGGEASVGAVAGVETVDVSLEKKLVTVGYDPAKAGLPALKAAIEDAGYTVH